MRRLIPAIAVSTASLLIPGCENQTAVGPPAVLLGDSVCRQCNMILSDERWATAMIVEGPRGPEPRLFDDFNCQVNYEVENPELVVLARWSHSYATRRWIHTEEAGFLLSPNLRTPMGSQVAAFASPSELENAKAELAGEAMTFDVAWNRLGFTGVGRNIEETDPEHPEQERNDGP